MVGLGGLGAFTGWVEPTSGLDREDVVERERIPREAVGERRDCTALEEIYVCIRDERCTHLVEVTDTNRKKTMTEKVESLSA